MYFSGGPGGTRTPNTRSADVPLAINEQARVGRGKYLSPTIPSCRQPGPYPYLQDGQLIVSAQSWRGVRCVNFLRFIPLGRWLLLCAPSQAVSRGRFRPPPPFSHRLSPPARTAPRSSATGIRCVPVPGSHVHHSGGFPHRDALSVTNTTGLLLYTWRPRQSGAYPPAICVNQAGSFSPALYASPMSLQPPGGNTTCPRPSICCFFCA